MIRDHSTKILAIPLNLPKDEQKRIHFQAIENYHIP